MTHLRWIGFILLAALLLSAPAHAQPLAPAQSRLGMNLAGPADWGSELPFVDVFRTSRKWISQRQGAAWGQGPALERDAHGFVTHLEPGCWADTPMCTLPPGFFPSGQYVCLYDGEGQVDFDHVAGIVSREPGRVVVNVDAKMGGFFLRLRATNPENYVRNIRVLLPGCEATYQQQPFNPALMQHWGSFNTVRFKDWMLCDSPQVSAMSAWADRPKLDDCNWTEKGVPVEVMCDLANRLHANPWFSLPAQASDDYVTQFATLAKQHLDPGLTVYLEYSNEVWNNIFPVNRYAMDQAKALGLGPAERPWEGAGMFYSRRSVQIFNLWEAAWGGRDRLVRVLSWQAVSPWWSDHIILPFEDAYQHADALSIAPYFGPRVFPQAQNDRQLAADQVLGWSLDQLMDYIEQTELPRALEAMRGQKAIADKYHLKLVCYEAGDDTVGLGPAQNNEALTQRLKEANRSPRMGAIFTTYLNAWRDAGGDLMCVFNSVSPWSKYGDCSLLEYNGDDTAKYQAVQAWNLANPKDVL